MKNDSCIVLFSGGTDSLCAAALAAQSYQSIHLLTCFDRTTKNSPIPTQSVKLLKRHFPTNEIKLFKCNTDQIVKNLSYSRFFKFFFKYRLLQTASCAHTSLSWHITAMIHSQTYGISRVQDGLTREMLHLPGHMDEFIQLMKHYYEQFQIEYSNPVRDWDVPEEQQLVDRFIINRHGFLFPSEENAKLKTTGQYLFKMGILKQPNIKGSSLDRSLQHDCYPFVLYNIILFWFYLNIGTFEKFKSRLINMITDKFDLFLSIHFKNKSFSSREDFYQSEEVNV